MQAKLQNNTKCNKLYFGKLIWGKTMYEADGTTSRNLVMLTNFTYHDNAWDGGEIYDPTSGKTYSCTLKLKDGKLNIRGYVGISIFGRSSVWERVP